jgi:hypothetical protein
MLERRQRRHPSLEVFADVVGPTEIKRAGTPFAPYDIRRRPAMRSSHARRRQVRRPTCDPAHCNRLCVAAARYRPKL